MLSIDEQVRVWVERVRAEYLEMPGLALTPPQMRRLWVLDAPLCDAVANALVSAGFLRRRPNNSYTRVANDV